MKKLRVNSQQNTGNDVTASDIDNQKVIVLAVIAFLKLFITETVAKRVVCLLFLAANISTSRIVELVSISAQTISKIRKAVSSGNIDSLFHIKSGGGRRKKLQTIAQAIIDMIITNNYHSLKEIVAMIKDKFGIVTSLSAVSNFLKEHGIKRLKCGSIPAKADPEAQRTFYESKLCPLMTDAKSGGITVLSMDASHFVMGSDFLGYIYGKARRFVRTFSGRMRYNVLGALNIVTKKMTTVTNNSYITASQVCELLKKLSLEYVGTPIYIILDNARYQKCKIVQKIADELSITLVYIPPYSPNLNVIERFWKYVKSDLRTKYFNCYQEFYGHIDSIVECCDENAKKSLETLITDKIQLFDDLVPINESTYVNKMSEKMVA